MSKEIIDIALKMIMERTNSINEMTMKQAILDYFNNVYSEREAARVHSIKRSTLQSRVKKILANNNSKFFCNKSLCKEEQVKEEKGITNKSKLLKKIVNFQIYIFCPFD